MIAHAYLVRLGLTHRHLYHTGVSAAAPDEIWVQWGQESAEIILPWAHGMRRSRQTHSRQLFGIWAYLSVCLYAWICVSPLATAAF
jgi:hypothetical protein